MGGVHNFSGVFPKQCIPPIHPMHLGLSVNAFCLQLLQVSGVPFKKSIRKIYLILEKVSSTITEYHPTSCPVCVDCAVAFEDPWLLGVRRDGIVIGQILSVSDNI